MKHAGVGRGIPVRGASCVYKLEARALQAPMRGPEEGPSLRTTTPLSKRQLISVTSQPGSDAIAQTRGTEGVPNFLVDPVR